MPIYHVTIIPEPIVDPEYRIEADSLEAAKEAAEDAFFEGVRDMVAFEVEGELADDQDEPADFAAGE